MSQITDLVRERVGIIVTRGLDSYGYLPVEEDKERFYEIAVNLLLSITERVEKKETISIVPLKSELLSGVFSLNFDQKLALNLFELISKSLYKEIGDSEILDPDTLLVYRKYEELVVNAIRDIDFLLKKEPSEYLSNIPQYSTSTEVVNLGVTKSRLLKVNRLGNNVNPPKSRLRLRYYKNMLNAVSSYGKIISSASRDINSILSDSQLNSELPLVDESLLTATFSGEGSKIYSDIKRLYSVAMDFGGYEGSPVGSISYQTMYHEYLIAMCYGRKLPGGGIGGDFGKFDEIYNQKTTISSISGLSFLDPFSYTRSGNQFSTAANPLVEKFKDGLKDRYVLPVDNKNHLNFVSLTLESVSVLCLKVGDNIRSLLNSPPKKIGNTSLHFEALSKVFPESLDIRIRSTGFTGAILSLLRSHKSFYSLLGSEPDLQDFSVQLNTVSNLIESLTQTIRTVGFKPGGYVPSLELTYYEPDREKIQKRLISIGFDKSEVQGIMSVSSFEELLTKLAPLSDSQDVISFFRAYDLTKLLYEFGGQEAVDQYINYLYGVDEQSSLLRLLEFLKRNRSKASKITESKYSKLIGYIISLTYAVNPENLSVLDSVLKYNNLDLLESVTKLVQDGLPSALKDKNSIELLPGTVAQMVINDNSGYEYQKPLWNSLIEQSSGNAKESLTGLYSKAEGITPSELLRDLRNPSPTSPLGAILDGVRGGRLTSLLRYCNIFGLLYTLSSYRNSHQLSNESADQFVILLDTLDLMEELSKRLKVVTTVFEQYSESINPVDIYSDSIVTAQNKEMGALLDLISGLELGDYQITESPGIGNARIPNGIRIGNSLTPEESSIVSRAGSSAGIFSSGSPKPVDSGSYVRIAISNLLSNGVVITDGYSISTSQPAVTEKTPIADYNYVYRVPQESTTSSKSASQFNPIESCKKFGGKTCEELGYSVEKLCSTGYNKSLFPEMGYGETSPSPAGISIDRPLGSYLSSNVEYAVVDDSHPQKFFSEAGITSATRSSIFRRSEMSCASLKDPFEYSACITMLKCTKFKPPYEGKYSLKFCPSTLNGGRLNKNQ